MASEAHLEVYQGDDYAADVTVLDGAGLPADLTGYTAQSQIRVSLTDASATPAAQFTVSITGNIVSLVLPSTITRDLTKTEYVWDLQVIDSTGWITTLLYGHVLMVKDVTRVYAPALTRV
jgi:hypothetical protein